MVNSLINPPIPWRFWYVYVRHPDGRIMYFRGKLYNGKYRKNLFIADFATGKAGDWSWNDEQARLFDKEPTFAEHNFSKVLQENPLRHKISYRGFDGVVLRSHLII